MKWKWPLVTRSRYDALDADRERIRGERDQFARDRDAQRAAARKAARQFTSADEELTATRIVNDRLTAANLAVARRLTRALKACARYRTALAAYGNRRTVPDVLEEHDVHRKALADALGDQKRHLNWDQLIAEVGRLNKAATEWMTECQAHATRADRLQRRLDDSLGLNTPAIALGATWQDRREQKMRYDA